MTLPSGTVTFLLTDIEGSSGWWERAPDTMRAALAAHDELIASVVAEHGGSIVKHLGDGCWAAFASAPSAAAAAIDFLRRHQGSEPVDGVRVGVRVGLHTGDVEPTGDDYFGPVVNRAARVTDLANADQIVCSSATAALLAGLDVRDGGDHELRGIGSDRIAVLHAPGMVTSATPLRRPVVPTNLPVARTTFVGRVDDVERVVAGLSSDGSLVTLVGPGGVGKTRLAVEVGSRLSGDLSGRVHFCDLVPLAEDDDVAEAVAEVVGARLQPGMDLPSAIVDFLRDRRVLVVLDNCEHVVDGVRELVDRLVGLPGVQVLATSREALGVRGEQRITVEPLPVGTDAVELFVERARRRHDRFVLDDGNRDAVERLVGRLDGIPLAIELAAARIKLLSPAEMVLRLDRGVDVLGTRSAGGRHDTLLETIRWSYDLLAADEALLFERMSVFAGGFGIDAVEQVCAGDGLDAADVLELMTGLLDKSMIVSAEIDGRQRFRLLETLRAFAAARLDERGDAYRWRRRHADHHLGLARAENGRLFTAMEADAWRVLDLEWPNLRAALDTFEADGDVDAGAELVVSLIWYASLSIRFELFAWARELLEVGGIEQHPAFTDLCGAAALGEYFTVGGDVSELAEAGLAANADDPNGFCRCALASVFLNNVHTAEASDALTSAWLASDGMSTGSRMWAHAFRTFHLCIHDPSPEAAEHAEAVARIAADTGSASARALAAWAQGQVRTFVDLDEGVRIWEEGREWARSLPREHLLDHLLVGLLLHVTASRGDLATVLADCRAALDHALEQHYFVGASHLFGVSAIALARSGDAETGALLVGSMIGRGHLPRRNASRALEEALADRLPDFLEAGRALGVTEAGRTALEALDAAIARVS